MSRPAPDERRPGGRRRARAARWGALALLAAVAAAGCLQRRTPPPGPPADGAEGLEAELQRQPRSVPLRLDLAARRAAAGETFAAVEQLEAARALGHREGLLFTRLAELYRAMGEHESAAEVLADAAGDTSADPETRAALSRAWLALGDFRAAAAALEPLAPGGVVDDPFLRERLARHRLLAGNWEAAAALMRENGGAEERALRGVHAIAAGRPRQAVRELSAAVAAAPDAWNRYLLARAYLAAGERARALEQFLAAGRLPEAPARAHAGAARILVELDRLEDAAAALRRAEPAGENDPEYWQARAEHAAARGRDAEAAVARGRAAAAAGDPWRAEEIYRAALAKGPGDGEARELLAALQESAERRDDSPAALAAAEEGARRWPRDAGFLRRLAELLLEQNRTREAKAAAERLRAAAAPDRAAEVADLLTRVALEMGDADRLEAQAAEYRRVSPRDPNPSLLLAEWSQQRGETGARDAALAHYREAAGAAPDHAEAQARLGSMLAEMRRYDEALPVLRRALTLAPRVLDGVPNVQLAHLYRRRGRDLEAAFHERRYRELRRLKDGWANRIPAMRRDAPPRDYLELGETALGRREQQTALAAFARAARVLPMEPRAWAGLAAAHKRLGHFEQSLDAMRRAHLLSRPAREARR